MWDQIMARGLIRRRSTAIGARRVGEAARGLLNMSIGGRFLTPGEAAATAASSCACLGARGQTSLFSTPPLLHPPPIPAPPSLRPQVHQGRDAARAPRRAVHGGHQRGQGPPGFHAAATRASLPKPPPHQEPSLYRRATLQSITALALAQALTAHSPLDRPLSPRPTDLEHIASGRLPLPA